jgi:hypothetical protein
MSWDVHARTALAIGVGAFFVAAAAPVPQFVAVRHAQGSLHGFLALRSLDGTTIADGDETESIAGDRVTSRTTFHYRDGSTSDEIAVFSQHGVYRLVSYRIVNTGPAFDHTLTMDVDVPSGHAVVRTVDDHGKEKIDDQTIALPPDLCNGMLITLLQDVDAAKLPLTVPFLANTPSPRMVRLVISQAGTAPFHIGQTSRTAVDYVVKTEIGGVAGLIAPLIGKQPANGHVWILTGDSPVFVKAEAPTGAGGGPVLRIELTNPAWPK